MCGPSPVVPAKSPANCFVPVVFVISAHSRPYIRPGRRHRYCSVRTIITVEHWPKRFFPFIFFKFVYTFILFSRRFQEPSTSILPLPVHNFTTQCFLRQALYLPVVPFACHYAIVHCITVVFSAVQCHVIVGKMDDALFNSKGHAVQEQRQNGTGFVLTTFTNTTQGVDLHIKN